jgi:PAS domain S-box-containing protein
MMRCHELDRTSRTSFSGEGVGHRVSKRQILIVESETTVARELERQLVSFGYEIAGIASHRDEAAALISQAAPDLALMQITSREGIDGLREGLERRAEFPVVFMTTESDQAMLRQAGATAVTALHSYIVKPYTARELHAVIELALCRHDAAKVVREMEDRFFADSIDMLCFLDFNGHFKRLNPAWERTLGFTREELMSRPFIEFVHPDDRERTLNQNAAVRGGGRALGFENRYRCKDGSYRWFHWNAAPNSSERVIYSVARDITRSKVAEAEREQMLRELQDALAEVKTLRAILPICSYCRKIRDDEDYWHSIENYISMHTPTLFSHGICPSCMTTEVEPRLERLMNDYE